MFPAIVQLVAAPLAAAVAQPSVTIELAHGSAAEIATRAQLLRLLAANDLSRWRFTKSVRIDDAAIPHSHPVLTLHTRHLRDDDLLLSTYLHEQLHWFADQRASATAAAMAELRATHSDLPVGFPDGAEDGDSNYLHLIVCLLEWQADRAAMGELRARAVMDFWAHDHYRAIYRVVLDRPEPILAVLRKHGLLVPKR